MSRYTSATEADRREMLAAVGADSIDDLFADVPEGVRLGRPLDLPPGKPEQEVYAYLRDLARRNVSAEDELCFPRHHVSATISDAPVACFDQREEREGDQPQSNRAQQP